jgi:hypothetical protein
MGVGVSLLNGGLLGFLNARRGGAASSLAWSTLLGPATVAGTLQHDLLVPFVQIAIGLALILGFFTLIAAVLAGFLIVSGPIFQFLAILSNSAPTSSAELPTQVLVSTGSINLLLLVAAVLWLTPMEGTPWSLDALIFAHRRLAPEPPPPLAAVAPEAEEPGNPGPSQGPPASISALRGE